MAIRRKPQKKNRDLNTVKRFRINRFIRVPEVRLIDDEGNNLGVIKTNEAQRMADEKELDLIEVSPLANPPVAKIMDYGKYKYEIDKQEKKNKSQANKTDTKGVRLTFRIKGGDLETKQKQALKFLDTGDCVKVEMILKGREKAHMDLAQEKMREFVESLQSVKVIQPLTRMGGRLSITVGR